MLDEASINGRSMEDVLTRTRGVLRYEAPRNKRRATAREEEVLSRAKLAERKHLVEMSILQQHSLNLYRWWDEEEHSRREY